MPPTVPSLERESRTLNDELLHNFVAALRPRVEGDLRDDAMTRALYATDASMYQIEPAAVLFPATAADVQAALEASARFGVPVVARGGGSSLAGQAVGRALVVDCSRYLDGILEIAPEAKTARVEPGVVLDDLNRAAAEHGLTVGPDPSSGSRATLGGMVATNATGTHSILYGNMVHHVRRVKGFLAGGVPVTFEPLSEEEWRTAYRREGREGALYRQLGALLSDGKDVIARDTPKHWRRNSGYRLEHLLPEGAFREDRPGIDGDPHFAPEVEGKRNPARLICGSEGSLMMLTEIELSLVERPAQTAVGVVHFRTRSGALRAVSSVLETGPSAVELFDGVAIERCRETPGYAELLTFLEPDADGGDPGGLLITEYYGENTADLAHKLDRLDEATRSLEGAYALVRCTTPGAIADVWTVRKEGLGLLMGVRGERKPWAFIEDAAVPVEELPGYVDAIDALTSEMETRTVFYAHASGGCLHIRPFLDSQDPEELEKMEKIARTSMEEVARRGGSVSSEHGDGRARGWLNEEFLGPELYQLNRRLKRIFDPDGLLNPGVVVDTPPMDQDLRQGPGYRAHPPATNLDFSADGGFAAAVERCNGNGACRKTHGGTMCPSYRVTREEEDSTRGRANALRAAISGALPPEALTSERMMEVMDLCIQCKACKTECPSNVDMGKLKTEWLSTYWEKNRMPLRTRLFSRLPEISRHVSGSVLARVANAASGLGPARTVLDWTLGVSRERKLPAFAPQSFRQWFEKQEGPDEGPPVALFPDTFTNFHAPHVARAAAEVLRALGMRVLLPEKTVCCGRTLLSKGRVSEAQVQAVSTVEALMPFARRGVPVVGLEPSCVSALTDDLPAMLPGDTHAEAVAEATLSFEAFLCQQAEQGRLRDAAWNDTERRVLLHGHCHQKALEGADLAARALSLPPGFTAERIEAGCCGMAGAFGYEKEHVDISHRMAEQTLAPAVRAAPDDALIAAPGFSCRSQIKDLTGREALHPAEVLREALRAFGTAE